MFPEPDLVPPSPHDFSLHFNSVSPLWPPTPCPLHLSHATPPDTPATLLQCLAFAPSVLCPKHVFPDPLSRALLLSSARKPPIGAPPDHLLPGVCHGLPSLPGRPSH